MIRHIVLLNLKAEATAEQLAAWRAAAIDMCEKRPEALSYTFGTNVGRGPNHFETALVAEFEDMEAFRRYVSGPVHKAYVDDHARHVVDKIAAIQHAF